ncbi:MAG: thiamine diphosphokinase [Syntrophales bacterium]|nr:thiamine diphosphokinase [Syntrophales bacterium]
MNKRIVFVLLGGSVKNPAFIKRMWEAKKPQAVICANGGAKYAWRAEIRPTLIVGDFDSLSREIKRHYQKENIPYQVYPTAKDETDAIIAYRQACLMAPDEIWLFGALGGRVDHFLANLSLLLMGEREGVFVKIVDEKCEMFLVSGDKVIEGKEGDVVSLLALFEDAAGVDLEGFLYPLSRGVLRRDFPLGVSNRLAAEKGFIRVRKGTLLVIKYFSF